jgi:FkbM family methyltransferase
MDALGNKDALYNKMDEPSQIEVFRSGGDRSNGRAAFHRSTLKKKFYSKMATAKILAEFMRYFSNWAEIWRAYRVGGKLPELRLRAGLTLSHSEDDCVLFTFREMFEEQPYTRGTFYLPKSTDTVLDVGANIGLFAIYLQSRAPGITVHCFEPAPGTRERLLDNLRINGLTSHMFVHPYAVSDMNGIVYLDYHAHTLERSLVVGARDTGSAEAVESVTFSRAIALCNAGTIDLLKIDIEGAELEMILGSPLEEWSRVKRVAMEYHESLRPGCLQLLTSALRERGFGQINSVPSQFETRQGILQARR